VQQGLRYIFSVLALGVACAVPQAPVMALDKVSLRVSGDHDTLKDALRASSVLMDLEGSGDSAPRDILAAAQSDYARLVEALYAQGFYGATVGITLDGVEAARIDPFSPPPRITKARITVDPGPAFRFGRAEIGPLTTPQTPGFRSGALALATEVRSAARSAVEGWRAAGHAKAQLADQQVLARHDQAQLDVVIRVDPGPRLRFGTAEVVSDSAVRAPRIRQIAGLPLGQVYAPDAVDRAAARLRKTGTFQSVTLREADQPNPDGTLDMEIAVTDRKPRRIGGGAELSSLDGLRLSGFWLHRNLLGGAERFRIDAEARQIGSTGQNPDVTLSFRFEKPAVYGPDTLFFAQADLRYQDESDFLNRELALQFGAAREFSPTLTGSLGITLRAARVTDRFTTPDTTRDLLSFGLPSSLTWDRRDDVLNPRQGSFLRAELEPFYEFRAAERGARFVFDARGYQPFGDQTVLAGRFQLGALLGPEAVDARPEHLFYSGGGGTVRGQPYQSLDADHDGLRLGGRGFVGLSGELRQGLTDKLGLVGFADAGFIGADGFGVGDWHSGAGLGLRYDTPVGPIRLDLAGPVGGTTGNGLQIYIGIGQAF
jgi:translocation and assembly module TamA